MSREREWYNGVRDLNALRAAREAALATALAARRERERLPAAATQVACCVDMEHIFGEVFANQQDILGSQPTFGVGADLPDDLPGFRLSAPWPPASDGWNAEVARLTREFIRETGVKKRKTGAKAGEEDEHTGDGLTRTRGGWLTW
jgi:hypothetical protein